MATKLAGAPGRGLRDMSYVQARRMLLAVGVSVLVVTAGVAYARRVDPVEVAATVLFLPVFIALVFWKLPGGAAAGVVAAVAYVLLRAPAISAVGVDLFARAIVSRAIAFPLFGALGGWAMSQMETALTKLELYDQVDDATGLYNARFFVEDTGLEVSRSDRYHTVFSVGVVEIPPEAFEAPRRRRAERNLADFGSLIRRSVRRMDRAVHARSGTGHRLAVILPETSREGARVFTERLAVRLGEHLAGRGVPLGPGGLAASWVSYPGDDADLQRLQDEFRAIDLTEHPPGDGGLARATGPPPA